MLRFTLPLLSTLALLMVLRPAFGSERTEEQIKAAEEFVFQGIG